MKIFRTGLQNFIRNAWLSGAMIIILILIFLSISFLLSLNILVRQTIDSVRQKVDLSLYLKSDVTQNSLNNLKTDLENLPEVKEVKIISLQEAFSLFKEKHQDDPNIIKSLEEINQNPFGPTLLVQTKSNVDPAPILTLVASPRYEDIIEERDFTNYQDLVNKVDFFGRRIKFLGFIISGIFILVAILIIFNAVRLSIYTRLEEIKMMRLVGASSWAIRGPFLAEILISVLIAAVISLALFLLLVYKFQASVASFLSIKMNLLNYLLSNGLLFLGGQIVLVVVLCWLAASVAMKKYLKT